MFSKNTKYKNLTDFKLKLFFENFQNEHHQTLPVEEKTESEIFKRILKEDWIAESESFPSISTNMINLEDTNIKLDDSKESRNEKKIKPKKEEKSIETEIRFSGKRLIIIL